MAEATMETGHQDVVQDADMDYYGKRLATCSSDKTVRVMTLGKAGTAGEATSVIALEGHEAPVWQVVWSHPKFGSLLASCSFDGKVIIWKEGSNNNWAQFHVFQEHCASVNSIAFAPHELGLHLACGSSDGSISILSSKNNGTSWDKTKIEQADAIAVTAVSWAPALPPGSLISEHHHQQFTHKLVSCGCDNTVKVWKMSSDGGMWKMDCFPALSKHSDWVRDVAWAPNLGLPKTTMASASQDGTVIIWTQSNDGDQWQGKLLHDFKFPVWRVKWSPTGNILSVSDALSNVTLWKELVDGEWVQITE